MFKKLISILLCFCFIFQSTGFAQVAPQLNLPGQFGLGASFAIERFRPIHLRYLSYIPQENNFKLLLDKGDTKDPQPALIEDTSKKLMEYFFIGLSLPNSSFWVNLRPDQEDSIIEDSLAKTDIGKVLLEADLQLKKDTALATSPDTAEGRQYWDKLYQKAGELFGQQDIEIPTVTRPWIVPGEIIIRESPEGAYIYKATLKVMLEEDYLKSDKALGKDYQAYQSDDPRLKVLNEYSSELLRELVIPKITKIVNSDKRYAALRQVYYSLILAQWFKSKSRRHNVTTSPDNAITKRIDKQDLAGLTSKTPWSKTTYFNAYKESFAKGEYNKQEEVNDGSEITVRQYFSGGANLDLSTRFLSIGAGLTRIPESFHTIVKEIPGKIFNLNIPPESNNIQGKKWWITDPFKFSALSDDRRFVVRMVELNEIQNEIDAIKSGFLSSASLIDNTHPNLWMNPIRVGLILDTPDNNVISTYWDASLYTGDHKLHSEEARTKSILEEQKERGFPDPPDVLLKKTEVSKINEIVIKGGGTQVRGILFQPALEIWDENAPDFFARAKRKKELESSMPVIITIAKDNHLPIIIIPESEVDELGRYKDSSKAVSAFKAFMKNYIDNKEWEERETGFVPIDSQTGKGVLEPAAQSATGATSVTLVGDQKATTTAVELKREELTATLDRYEAVYFFAGHGSKGQFNKEELQALKDQLDRDAKALDQKHGHGRWMIVYGGDPSKPEKPDIGYAVWYLHENHEVPVMMVQTEKARDYGIPSHVTYVHFYPTETNKEGKTLYGGTDEAGNPVAATAIYLSDEFIQHGLKGMFAYGGGAITGQEIAYGVKKGIPFEYRPFEVAILGESKNLNGEAHEALKRLTFNARPVLEKASSSEIEKDSAGQSAAAAGLATEVKNPKTPSANGFIFNNEEIINFFVFGDYKDQPLSMEEIQPFLQSIKDGRLDRKNLDIFFKVIDARYLFLKQIDAGFLAKLTKWKTDAERSESSSISIDQDILEGIKTLEAIHLLDHFFSNKVTYFNDEFDYLFLKGYINNDPEYRSIMEEKTKEFMSRMDFDEEAVERVLKNTVIIRAPRMEDSEITEQFKAFLEIIENNFKEAKDFHRSLAPEIKALQERKAQLESSLKKFEQAESLNASEIKERSKMKQELTQAAHALSQLEKTIKEKYNEMYLKSQESLKPFLQSYPAYFQDLAYYLVLDLGLGGKWKVATFKHYNQFSSRKNAILIDPNKNSSRSVLEEHIVAELGHAVLDNFGIQNEIVEALFYMSLVSLDPQGRINHVIDNFHTTFSNVLNTLSNEDKARIMKLAGNQKDLTFEKIFYVNPEAREILVDTYYRAIKGDKQVKADLIEDFAEVLKEMGFFEQFNKIFNGKYEVITRAQVKEWLDLVFETDEDIVVHSADHAKTRDILQKVDGNLLAALKIVGYILRNNSLKNSEEFYDLFMKLADDLNVGLKFKKETALVLQTPPAAPPAKNQAAGINGALTNEETDITFESQEGNGPKGFIHSKGLTAKDLEEISVWIRNNYETLPLGEKIGQVELILAELKKKVESATISEDIKSNILAEIDRIAADLHKGSVVTYGAAIGVRPTGYAFAGIIKTPQTDNTIALMDGFFSYDAISSHLEYQEEILLHEILAILYPETSHTDHKARYASRETLPEGFSSELAGIQRDIFGNENRLKDAIREYASGFVKIEFAASLDLMSLLSKFGYQNDAENVVKLRQDPVIKYMFLNDPSLGDELRRLFGELPFAFEKQAAHKLYKINFEKFLPNLFSYYKSNIENNFETNIPSDSRLFPLFFTLFKLLDIEDIDEDLKMNLENAMNRLFQDINLMGSVQFENLLDKYVQEFKEILSDQGINANDAKLKAILVEMIRWGINLGYINAEKLIQSLSFEVINPTFGIVTLALAGLGDITKIDMAVRGIRQELNKRGIKQFRIKIFVLGADREKMSILTKDLSNIYPEVELINVDRDKMRPGDDEIKDVDVLITLVRPVAEVLDNVEDGAFTLEVPTLNLTLGEYDSVVPSNQRMRTKAFFEIPTGFSDDSVGFFINPFTLELYEKIKKMTDEERINARKKLLWDLIQEINPKFSTNDFPNSDYGKDTGLAIDQASRFSAWAVIYMHHAGIKYLRALNEYLKSKKEEKSITIFTFFGEKNREQDDIDEFYELAEDARRAKLDMEFYDIREGWNLTGLDFKKRVVRVINLGMRSLNANIRTMALSDLPLGVTGDESLLTTVTLRKPFFYETMAWKQRLFEGLIETMASIKDSKVPEENLAKIDIPVDLEEFSSNKNGLGYPSVIFDESAKTVFQNLGDLIVTRALYPALTEKLLKLLALQLFVKTVTEKYSLDTEDLEKLFQETQSMPETQKMIQTLLQSKELKKQFSTKTFQDFKLAIDTEKNANIDQYLKQNFMNIDWEAWKIENEEMYKKKPLSFEFSKKVNQILPYLSLEGIVGSAISKLSNKVSQAYESYKKSKKSEEDSTPAPSISSTGIGNERVANRNILKGILEIAVQKGKITADKAEKMLSAFNADPEAYSEAYADFELEIDNENVFLINGQKVIVIDAPFLSTTEEGEQYASAGLRRQTVYITRAKYKEWEEAGILDQKIKHEQDEVAFLRNKAVELYPELSEEKAYEELSRFLKNSAKAQEAAKLINEAHNFAVKEEVKKFEKLEGQSVAPSALRQEKTSPIVVSTPKQNGNGQKLKKEEEAKTIIEYIAQNPSRLKEIINRLTGMPLAEMEKIELLVGYHASGRMKDVFKVEIKTEKETKHFILALKTNRQSGDLLFEEGELQALKSLQGTRLVPVLGGVLYVLFNRFSPSGYGEVVTNTPAAEAGYTTMEMEEYIEGKTLEEYIKGGEMTEEISMKAIETLMDVLFSLNPKEAETYMGPYDLFTSNLILDDNDPAKRVVFVDIGGQKRYSDISEYLEKVLYFYGGQTGEALEVLNQRWPDKDWNAILHKVKESMEGKRRVLIEDQFKASYGLRIEAIDLFLKKLNDAAVSKSGIIRPAAPSGASEAIEQPVAVNPEEIAPENIESSLHDMRERLSKATGDIEVVSRDIVSNREVARVKIGNDQFIFYRSLYGTDGKQQGQWFPIPGWLSQDSPIDGRLKKGWFVKDRESVEDTSLVVKLVREKLEGPDTFSYEQKLSQIKNFGDLYVFLQNTSPLKGSQGNLYSYDDLKNIIEKVRNRELGIEYVTRSFGLRNKVAELLVTDSYEQKLSQIKNLDDLEKYLRKQGALNVNGSQKKYSGPELADIIKEVRNHNLEINYVTRSFGLRDKVAELLAAEALENSSRYIVKKENIRIALSNFDIRLPKDKKEVLLNELTHRVLDAEDQRQPNVKLTGLEKLGVDPQKLKELGVFLDGPLQGGMTLDQLKNRDSEKGGIDFRALPMINQPGQGKPTAMPQIDFSTWQPVINMSNNLDADKEWQEIEKSVQEGNIPSCQKLQGYLLACCQKQGAADNIDKILACVADIFRIEEDNAQPTEQGLKEVLFLLESEKPFETLQGVIIQAQRA